MLSRKGGWMLATQWLARSFCTRAGPRSPIVSVASFLISSSAAA